MRRLTKDDPHFDADLRVFLSQAYNLNAVADYETGPGSEISPERAHAAELGARRIVAHIETALTA